MTFDRKVASYAFEERWAVVAYVRALEVSQSVALDDLPAVVRSEALTRLAVGGSR